MTSYHNTIKMPFAVSLALIFSYSLLQIAVPTEPETVEAAVATPQDMVPRTAPLDEQIITVSTTNEPGAKTH
jgi:hypothetical protein